MYNMVVYGCEMAIILKLIHTSVEWLITLLKLISTNCNHLSCKLCVWTVWMLTITLWAISWKLTNLFHFIWKAERLNSLVHHLIPKYPQQEGRAYPKPGIQKALHPSPERWGLKCLIHHLLLLQYVLVGSCDEPRLHTSTWMWDAGSPSGYVMLAANACFVSKCECTVQS